MRVVTRHLYPDRAMAEVNARYGTGEISDAAAATIASWWQSAGYGRALAALASGAEFSVTDLLEDIAYVRRDGPLAHSDSRALDMLATWAINHPDR